MILELISESGILNSRNSTRISLNNFCLALLGLLRVGNDAKFAGGHFFPLGMGLQLPKNVKKVATFRQNLYFV